MESEVNWGGLARYLAGESPEAEQEEVLAWAEADPRNAEVLETARRTWRATGEEARRWDTEAAWSCVQTRMEARTAILQAVPGRRGSASLRSRWTSLAAGTGRMAVAAAIAIVLAGGALAAAFWVGGQMPAGSVTVQELVTPKRGRVEARLDDGTTVTLGPDSRLLVSASFGDARREVELVGEAFFEVAHDAARPFVVRSGSTVARVLGTEFNVRAYPEDPSVQVVVAGGRVAFGPEEPAGKAPALLTPGDLGEMARGATEVVRRRVDPAAYLSWREGRLSFEDAPLSQVAAQLERWYGVPVRVGDDSVRNRRLTASFRDQPLDEVVAVVAISLGLEFARVGQAYTFYSRGRAPVLANS